MIPSIQLTSEEFKTGVIQEDTLLKAKDLFVLNGVLLVKNVFFLDFIKILQKSFFKKYKSYFYDKKHTDALKVGDKRFMITVNLQHPFNTYYLYANPHIFPIVQQILGENCILNSFTSVVSLPGSKDQNPHHDHPQLFDDDTINTSIPCYVVDLMIPLVEMNKINGSTRVFCGSHKVSFENGKRMASYVPVVPIGSCILMDYRIYHGGTANCSKHVRPLLCINYSRPWFRDCANFDKQPTIKMSKKEYKKVPEAYRKLFSFVILN